MSTLQCCSHFCQILNLLKRILQAKTVPFRLLKGVTVPDVLCLPFGRYLLTNSGGTSPLQWPFWLTMVCSSLIVTFTHMPSVCSHYGWPRWCPSTCSCAAVDFHLLPHSRTMCSRREGTWTFGGCSTTLARKGKQIHEGNKAACTFAWSGRATWCCRRCTHRSQPSSGTCGAAIISPRIPWVPVALLNHCHRQCRSHDWGIILCAYHTTRVAVVLAKLTISLGANLRAKR